MPYAARLTWPPHAEKRLRQRRITKTEVKGVVANPSIDVESEYSARRRVLTAQVGSPARGITVVVAPYPKSTKIITAWRAKR
jgi:Domain of unknown function (DUF4258)